MALTIGEPTGSAVFSPCGLYRYWLERRLPSGRLTASVTMLNPSVAGPQNNDPTVRKLLGFGQRMDVGRWIATNFGAFKSTDPQGIKSAADPVGPDNDRHILAAVAESDIVIAAWGASVELFPNWETRREVVLELLASAGKPVMCWGGTRQGHPRHPLMLPYSTQLERFV